MRKLLSTFAALFLIAACGDKPAEDTSQSAQRGITDTEIILGTHQDLSGPIVAWGTGVTNGLRMAFSEVNAAGGIHGRKITLIVEDTGYDPKRAVLAMTKLVNKDNVFAIIGGLGTPTTVAAMPIALKKDVLHLFPFTAAEQAYLPYHKYKFGAFTPYYYQSAMATDWFMDELGAEKVGILYQDDDYGLNVHRGVELALERRGAGKPVVTTFKRGATDFSAQIARLRAEGVDAVILGTVVRETAGAVKAARDIGWDVPFIGSAATYTPETLEVGGEALDGIMAMGQTPIPYHDDPNPAVGEWIDRYEGTYNQVASAQALAAYSVARFLIKALEQAGPDLTADDLVKVIEDMESWTDPDFGGVPLDFEEGDHLGARQSFLARAEGGRWIVISDLMSFEETE